MRVLQAGGSLVAWGGIERYVVYLSEGLRGQGVEVVTACPPDSPLDRHSAGHTIPVRIHSRVSPASIGKYLGILRKGKFHVAHAHFSPEFVCVGLGAKLAKTPVRIMTRHLALPWKAAKVQRNLALFDHIVPVSDAVFKVLKQSGVPEYRMTVAKAGVPTLTPSVPRPQARQALGLEDDQFALGIFGRLVQEKGTHVLVDAVALMPPSVRLHVFGEGPEKGKLARQIHEKGLDKRAKLHGYVPDVVDTMSAMDAIVIPSLWAEAFPYAALEALSVGVPVLASKIGGLPELVRDGVNGLLAPPNDAKAIVTNVLILLADKTLGPGLGQTGKEIHQARYTVEKMGERFKTLYTKELHFKGLTDF